MISMCLACFLFVRVSEFTSHIFVQPFYLFIFILWLWKHARSLLRSMFSVGVCVCFVRSFLMVCVCAPRNKRSKLTQWQFLAERQWGPAIQQQRLCCFAPLGLLRTSFFLSFCRFLSLFYWAHFLVWSLNLGRWPVGRGERVTEGGKNRGRKRERERRGSAEWW